MSLHRERGHMVIDDVRGLPAAPIIVAEGSTVPASVVGDGIADRTRALWLLPTPGFLRAQRAGHEAGARALYSLLREVIEQEAQENGAPMLPVDGSRGVDEMTKVVEERFAAAIAEGPCADTLEERRALLREANEAVVEQVRGYFARPWAQGDPEQVVRSFLCECGETRCSETVSVTVEVAAEPVYAAGHG
jgi:hypothetical protein